MTKYDPESGSFTDIMVVDGPINNVDFITTPTSPSDTSESEDEDEADESETGGKDIGETSDGSDMKPGKPDGSTSEKKKYMYYISNGKVIMVNVKDPDDKEELSRTGATKYVMDGTRGVLYYVMFDRNIVRENIAEGGSPNFIVTGIGSVGDLVLDQENNVIYFTDTNKGQIEKYDINTEFRRVLYRNLRDPSNLSFSDGFVKTYFLWV